METIGKKGIVIELSTKEIAEMLCKRLARKTQCVQPFPALIERNFAPNRQSQETGRIIPTGIDRRQKSPPISHPKNMPKF